MRIAERWLYASEWLTNAGFHVTQPNLSYHPFTVPLLPQELLPLFGVILFGSIWPEDAEKVLTTLNGILEKQSAVKVIIAPHQPTAEIIYQLTSYLNELKIEYFSQNNFDEENNVLIIDKVGILADLYKYADIAYVGGSFKQGIHNVMEPAIYGIPVIYGPVYTNSYEAIKLLKEGGSRVVSDEEEFKKTINEMINQPKKRQRIGEKGYSFATKNIGGTEKIISKIKEWLKTK